MLFFLPRLFLHDDVHEGLSDVRRKAVEDMKKLREKSGTLKGCFYIPLELVAMAIKVND